MSGFERDVPDVSDEVDRGRIMRFLNGFVQVKYVIPAYVILAVTGILGFYVQQANIEARSLDRDDQLALVEYLSELRQYDDCIGQVRFQSSTRDVLMFLSNLESIRDSLDAMVFRQYLDERLPSTSEGQCGEEPDMPRLPSGDIIVRDFRPG